MAKPRMERTHHTLITEGVAEHEQTLAVHKPFWVFFVSNISIAAWLMGVLIANMNISFSDAMFVILLGSVIGSAIPALIAVQGPAMRLSQMEAGRFSLGQNGKKLPAFLNWVGAVGWDVVNNILSAAALVSLLMMGGLGVPFWLSLGILVGIQLIIGVYGHHLIQDTSKYTGVLLGAFFILIGVIAMHKAGGVPAADKTSSIKDVIAAFALLVSNNAGGWSPFATDYTRYLPKQTPARSIFLAVFASLFLSSTILVFFGYMTAAAVTEQTPMGVMNTLQALSGSFAPLALFLIAFSAIPANAVNDNSAAYSLISMGIKLSRPVSAIFGAVIGYVLCLEASASFTDFFENFLFLMIHWVGPWAAIILVHWYVLGKKKQSEMFGITIGGVIFVVVSAASVLLFSSNTLYAGLLSGWVGGADVGPYIGFVVAGALYYAALNHSPKSFFARSV